MKVSHGREDGKPSVRRTETVTGEMWATPYSKALGTLGEVMSSSTACSSRPDLGVTGIDTMERTFFHHAR